MDSAFRVSLVLTIVFGAGWLGVTGYYMTALIGQVLGHPRFAEVGSLRGPSSVGWRVAYAFLTGMMVTAASGLVTAIIYIVRGVVRSMS